MHISYYLSFLNLNAFRLKQYIYHACNMARGLIVPFSSRAFMPRLTAMELSRQLCIKMRKPKRSEISVPVATRGLEIHFYLPEAYRLEYLRGCHSAEDLCTEAARKCGKVAQPPFSYSDKDIALRYGYLAFYPKDLRLIRLSRGDSTSCFSPSVGLRTSLKGPTAAWILLWSWLSLVIIHQI